MREDGMSERLQDLIYRQSFNNPDMEEGTMKVQDVMTVK
jgi:hypothetical protein